MSAMGYFLDHRGDMIGPAPLDPYPTAYRWDDQRTHRLMRPSQGALIQAVTWCGRRGLEVPGRGDVDCPECLAEMAGDSSSERPHALGMPSGNASRTLSLVNASRDHLHGK